MRNVKQCIGAINLEELIKQIWKGIFEYLKIVKPMKLEIFWAID